MTAQEKEILAMVLDCAATLNAQRPPDQQFEPEPEWVLVGDGGALDSLGLVSLLVMVEEAVEGRFGVGFSLIDEIFSEDVENRAWTIADLTSSISNELAAL